MPLSRRGFTLAETLVALVLVGAIGAVLFSVLTSGQRLSRGQAERATLQSNVRTGAVLVQAELRELAAGPGTTTDISAMAPDSITYRAMRGLGFLCEVSTTQVKLASATRTGYRLPASGGDTLLVFVETDPNTATDDQWVVAPVSSVGTGTCPNGAAAVVIGTTLTSAQVAGIVVGSPARYFETMTLRSYTSNGQLWLGLQARSAGATIQPVVGPLATGGFQLAFLDSTGTATTNAARVRRIQVTLRGQTSRVISGGAGNQVATQVGRDSVTTQVALRNAVGP